MVQPGESLIRAGYLACMCAMVTGRLLADGLVNRFGVTPVLQLSGLCIAAGLSLALLWPDLLPATAGLALVGFGMASVVPLCYSLAGKSTRVPPSVAISLVSSLSFLGFLGCPPMVGFLSHQFDLRWALSPIVVVGVASFAWRRWSGASRPKGALSGGRISVVWRKRNPFLRAASGTKNGSPSREMAQTQFRLP